MTEHHELAFSFDLLLGAAEKQRDLRVCDLGHLVVAGRTHWAPRALNPTLTSIICDWVEHPDE